MNERRGVISASIAYGLWGILPLYWKLLSHVHAYEIMLHRIMFSALSLFIVVIIGSRMHELWIYLHNVKVVRRYALSAILIGFNWFLYIYAVLTGQTIEASLGYYICPLIVVLLGKIFFKEKVSRSSNVALLIVTFAIILQIMQLGRVPIIALVLALSFASYGMIRKQGNLDSTMGLTLETLLLFPFALAAFLFLFLKHDVKLFAVDIRTDILLILSGVITSVPLLLYGHALSHAKFSTVGFLQYIGPTMSLLIGWVIFKENLSLSNGITFVIVGIGLLFFIFQPLDQKNLL